MSDVLISTSRIAGRKLVYVRSPSGAIREHTLASFRLVYGLPAKGLPTGTLLTRRDLSTSHSRSR